VHELPVGHRIGLTERLCAGGKIPRRTKGDGAEDLAELPDSTRGVRDRLHFRIVSQFRDPVGLDLTLLGYAKSAAAVVPERDHPHLNQHPGGMQRRSE
jgi:hypothetical protein